MKQYWCGKCGFVRLKTKPSVCVLCRGLNSSLTSGSTARRFYLSLVRTRQREADRSFTEMMVRYQAGARP